jgi:hypothetical protein
MAFFVELKLIIWPKTTSLPDAEFFNRFFSRTFFRTLVLRQIIGLKSHWCVQTTVRTINIFIWLWYFLTEKKTRLYDVWVIIFFHRWQLPLWILFNFKPIPLFWGRPRFTTSAFDMYEHDSVGFFLFDWTLRTLTLISILNKACRSSSWKRNTSCPVSRQKVSRQLLPHPLRSRSSRLPCGPRGRGRLWITQIRQEWLPWGGWGWPGPLSTASSSLKATLTLNYNFACVSWRSNAYAHHPMSISPHEAEGCGMACQG